MSVYRSIYLPPHIPTNLSFSQYLNTYNPDAVSDSKTILEDDWTGQSLTYQGIRDIAARHADALKAKLGLQDGDVVAICAPNSVAHVQLIHAVLWAGGKTALLGTLSTVDDFVHFFRICQPQVVVVDLALLGKVKSGLQRVPDLHKVKLVILGKDGPDNLCQYPRDFENNSKSPIFDLSGFDNRDVTAVICFSSGTSGKPKGVELTHHALIASLATLRSSDPTIFNAENRRFHTLAILTPFMGSYVMIMKSFTLDRFLHLSSKKQANTMRIVPNVALAIAKSVNFDEFDLKAMKYILCSGATLPNDVIRVLHARLNEAPIFQGYGMTESIASTILRPHEAHNIGSVGRLIASVEVRIVDDEMKDVEAGQEGEMLLRGPTIFRRYMNDEKATQEAFHQGWMKTGDILRVDSDGLLYLTERKKEMIKYNGQQIAPAELEGILVSHPFVSEGTVCANWDKNQGTEVPMAYVTLSEKGKTYEGGLINALNIVREFVDGKVAPYKKLRGGIEVLNELPKTPSGKILKRLLPVRLEIARRSKI